MASEMRERAPGRPGRTAPAAPDRARRRVLYVQRPAGGGSMTGLYDLLRSLDRDRWEPWVLLHGRSRYEESLRDLGVGVLRLDDAGARPMRSPAPVGGGTRRLVPYLRGLARIARDEWPVARRMAGLVRGHGIDLVHHNNNPAANRVSILAARLAGVPQIAHVRFLRGYMPLVDPFLARHVDFFIYMSAAIESQCRPQLRIPARRGEIVYDPFDLERFGRAAGKAAESRERLGVPAGATVVANVGRLVPWKGQDVFLRALVPVIRAHPDVRALIVGDADDRPENRRYHRALQRLVSELGLESRVVFTGHRDDIPEVMAASDIIVHSATRPEPFGRVVVEGMAASRPVVATAAGGVPEIVAHGESGLLVAPEAPAMAAAILELVADPERARAMGRRGRAIAEERFSADRFAGILQERYEQVLGAASPRRPALRSSPA